MKYLLDTNVCIRYINGRSPQIRVKILNVLDEDIVICAITKAEMFYGAAKSQYPERSRTKQEAFFSRFVSIAFDDNAAQQFGSIRANLEKAGIPIGAYDMQIAAIALSNSLIVVTHNTKEFSRISGLKIEDWEI